MDRVGYDHAIAEVCRKCDSIRLSLRRDNDTSMGVVAYPCGAIYDSAHSCGGSMVSFSVEATDRILVLFANKLAVRSQSEEE